jgi:hypothetical protein
LKLAAGRKRISVPAASTRAVDSLGAPIVTQAPLKYCQAPWVVTALPVMATPARVSPTSTSLKCEPNRVETVWPAGATVSSLTAVRVAVPLATGASLLGVTVIPSVMAVPYGVEPPVVVRSAVAPVVTAPDESSIM